MRLSSGIEERYEIGIDALILVVFCVDIIFPFLNWKHLAPTYVRWISHASLAGLTIFTLLRSIYFNHLPKAIFLVLFCSIVWVYIAMIQGQSLLPTLWGWWLMFPIPLVAIFAFLQPRWPKHFPRQLTNVLGVILILEVFLQVVEYLLGVPPGDDLNGTFGTSGSGELILFIILVNCLFFGDWIIHNRWKALMVILPCSLLSSVLGEIKMYVVAVALLGMVAVVLNAARNHSLWKLSKYSLFILVAVVGFVFLYNTVVPGAKKYPLQRYITDPALLDRYLNLSEKVYDKGVYYTNMGRNYAFSVGWNSIKKDPLSLLFGLGIGARSESRTLGVTGGGLEKDTLGLAVGTSLLVMMQELGLVGLTLLAAFFLWVIVSLARDIRLNPSSPATGFRYALILFSVFWPLWLWYATAWTARVPMLIYWLILGYVFYESMRPLQNVRKLIGKEKDSYG